MASANIHQREKEWKDRKEGKKNTRPKTNGKHTNSFYAFSILIIVKEEREKKGGQATIGKNILVERKEKQSRLEMYVDVEYVQKKCTHTHSSYLHIFSFLELPHARPLVYFHTLSLRNVANKEKNGRCTTLDLGYVVIEITKKEKIKSSPLYDDHQQIGIPTIENKKINSKNITERTNVAIRQNRKV